MVTVAHIWVTALVAVKLQDTLIESALQALEHSQRRMFKAVSMTILCWQLTPGLEVPWEVLWAMHLHVTVNHLALRLFKNLRIRITSHIQLSASTWDNLPIG